MTIEFNFLPMKYMYWQLRMALYCSLTPSFISLVLNFCTDKVLTIDMIKGVLSYSVVSYEYLICLGKKGTHPYDYVCSY